MNKKSIMLSFFLRLVLALLIFIPTVIFFSSLFRLSESGIESFNKLADLVDEIALQDNVLESTALRMDHRTMVAAIGKQGTVEYLFDDEVKEYLESPDICEKDKSCLCLCRDFNKIIDKNNEDYVDGKNILCKEEICYVVEEIDFTGLKSDQFTGEHKLGSEKAELKGGLIFSRNKDKESMSQIYGGGGALFYHYNYPDKINTIYIQKKDDKIVFCFENPPCIIDFKDIFYKKTYYGDKDDWRLDEIASGATYLELPVGTKVPRWRYYGNDKRVPYIYGKDSSGLKEEEFEKIFDPLREDLEERYDYEGIYYDGKYYGKRDDWLERDNRWYYTGDEEVPDEFKIGKKGIGFDEKSKVFGGG